MPPSFGGSTGSVVIPRSSNGGDGVVSDITSSGATIEMQRNGEANAMSVARPSVLSITNRGKSG